MNVAPATSLCRLQRSQITSSTELDNRSTIDTLIHRDGKSANKKTAIKAGSLKMATAVASIEDLRLYFEAKCAKVLQIIELKGIEEDENSMEVLKVLHQELTELEDMINAFKNDIKNAKTLFKEAENLKKVLQSFKERGEYIASNMPKYLPGARLNVPISQPVLCERDKCKENEIKKQDVKSSKTVVNYHKIGYLTMEEFENAPRYLKGRMKYAQVNSAIDQMNEVLMTKYKILATKRAGMGEDIMKKYREFKEQENEETKGCYFFVDKDLKQFTNFKMDKTGMAILNILRHCSKLREKG
ncbi:spindle and kinetochore-associated protein 1-like isoform X4 [Xenia sp. Carnegie-2017]|uniref:spindle and kinetochore-associated protein 1-like isoform X4 n=1 Tax=Xenia sp. Carnegie-2017 TaxID=2897299 RepID=UPI001F03792E|nr:spindle and kinetochore-associated protein 1-like isoform X4 [Xenia sp. Carnegie-2017]